MQVAVKPYQIPYRIMLPKRARGEQSAGAGGVFGEPRGVFFGAHGAAVHDPRPGRGRAAEMAITANSAMQDLAMDKLTAKLRSQGAIMEYTPSAQDAAIRLFEARKR